MCCDAAHGCGVVSQDWLKSATYEGEEILSGETFNKWSIMGNYLITQMETSRTSTGRKKTPKTRQEDSSQRKPIPVTS